jgi:predicted enzyme related to lactoylglutathione lyase
MKNALSWFEIPVRDMERACRFYSQIFQIDMKDEAIHGEYIAQFPADDDGVGGALILGDGYEPSSNGTIVYLNAGEDLNDVLFRVEAAGGRIINSKMEVIPGRVYAAHFQDSEGNNVGLFSSK